MSNEGEKNLVALYAAAIPSDSTEFVERAQRIVSLNNEQKRSLINYARKHPEFIDALIKHSRSIIDKFGLNGGLSQPDMKYINTLVIMQWWL